MTDGTFCAQCLSQCQEILSKTRLFGTRNCSKQGRSLCMRIHFPILYKWNMLICPVFPAKYCFPGVTGEVKIVARPKLEPRASRLRDGI